MPMNPPKNYKRFLSDCIARERPHLGRMQSRHNIRFRDSARLQVFNNIVIRLFSRPTPEADLEAIRDFLLDYYEKALQKEVDRVIEENGISRADFDAVLARQQRTKL